MKQIDTLALADYISKSIPVSCLDAAKELRRLHSVNQELLDALEYVVRGIPDTWEGVTKARAAIKKAKGEDQ